MAKLPIADLSRQLLVRGTSCFTTPDGNTGFKNEDLQVSALVRMAAAMEQQTQLLRQVHGLADNPDFTAEQRADGQNHLLLSQVRGERELTIRFLASSPALAQRVYNGAAGYLRVVVDQAEQWETPAPPAPLLWQVPVPNPDHDAYRLILAEYNVRHASWPARRVDVSEAADGSLVLVYHSPEALYFWGRQWGEAKASGRVEAIKRGEDTPQPEGGPRYA